MKRKIYLALVLTVLAMCLCACAESAGAEKAPMPAGTHDPLATPYVRLMPGEEEIAAELPDAEKTVEHIESYEDFVDSFYGGHVGNFRFHQWELDMFRDLDQTAPYSFTLHQLPGADGDRILAEYEQQHRELKQKYLSLEAEALAGRVIPADSDYREKYPEFCEHFPGDFIELMPEEWFELRMAENELVMQIMERRRQADLEYAMASAREFIDLGCDALVRACRSMENGQEYYSYICTVTLTPEKLWEISESTEKLYFIEQLYESVRLRHDIPVELGEGA